MTRFFLLAASTIALAGCATVEAAPIAAAPAAATGEDQSAPDTMRWLYGSGEAA